LTSPLHSPLAPASPSSSGAGAVFPYKLLLVPTEDLCGVSAFGVPYGLMCDAAFAAIDQVLTTITAAGDSHSEVTLLLRFVSERLLILLFDEEVKNQHIHIKNNILLALSVLV